MNEEQKQFIDRWRNKAQDWYMQTVNQEPKPYDVVETALNIVDNLLDAMMFQHDEIRRLAEEIERLKSEDEALRTISANYYLLKK